MAVPSEQSCLYEDPVVNQLESQTFHATEVPPLPVNDQEEVPSEPRNAFEVLKSAKPSDHPVKKTKKLTKKVSKKKERLEQSSISESISESILNKVNGTGAIRKRVSDRERKSFFLKVFTEIISQVQ